MMASSTARRKTDKVSVPSVHSARAIAGGLLVNPVEVFERIRRFNLGPEHFSEDVDALRVHAAAHRLNQSHAPLEMSALVAEGGLGVSAAERLIEDACIVSYAVAHAEKLVLAHQKRLAAAAIAESSTVSELRQAIIRIGADIPAGENTSDLISLADVPDPVAEMENPAALFKGGWLRKGGGALLVAPSGVGKSVWTIQAATLWAMGLPAFGIEPVRPLRIAVIQAEDDAEEVAFFRNNIREGLAVYGGLDRSSVETAMRSGVMLSEMVGAAGDGFVSRLGNLLMGCREIDLVVVNPFQSYFGGDVSHNAEVTDFLRAGIDPIIKPARAAVLFVNHTNKPPNAKERKGWGTDAFSAYIGAGGAELVNWARAVLALMPVEDVPGVFRLVAGKRGQRLAWTDESGARTNQRLIAHSEPPLIFWRDATDEERTAASGAVNSELRRFDPVKDAEFLAEHLRKAAEQAPALRDFSEESFGRARGRQAYKYLTDHLAGFKLSSVKAKHKGALFFGTRPDAEFAARAWDQERGVNQ